MSYGGMTPEELKQAIAQASRLPRAPQPPERKPIRRKPIEGKPTGRTPAPCRLCGGNGWIDNGAACTIADHNGSPLPHYSPCPQCGGGPRA